MSLNQDSGGITLLSLTPRQFFAGLVRPSTLLLIAANAVPLLGVLYWGWDIFVLLILYWMETAIIGFWMIVSMLTLPTASLGTVEVGGKPVTGIKSATAHVAVAAFFLVHAGGFMTVHMVFLWSLFSGSWADRIHGPGDFWRKLVIGTDLWIPLLFLFAVRGFGVMMRTFWPSAMDKLSRAFNAAPPPPPDPRDPMGNLIGGFYGRVMIMHVTILFSAFIAAFFGTMAPLLIMVVIKTLADVSLHIKLDLGRLQKTSQTLTAVTSR